MFLNIKTVFLLRRKLWKLCYGYLHASVLYMVLLYFFLAWVSWEVSGVISDALKPPSPPDNDLSHFRRSRNLTYYLENIELLIEPSSMPCTLVEEIPVLVLVASSPGRLDHREAIRNTWGRHVPTYFILGLDEKRTDAQLIDNYVEAKQYGDLVIYDFQEHYQNLTLKTSLMLKWTLERCSQAQFLYKTDDDTVINPWMLKQVLLERGDNAKLLGHVLNNSMVFREKTHKWYLPRWLFHEDIIPQYLSGPGYLINGEYIRNILKAASRVPLHNIEDVYFTYNVAKKALGYELTHDSRLSCYRPRPSWLPIACAYWTYASLHSFNPNEIRWIWSYIQDIGKQHAKGKTVCGFYNKHIHHLIKIY